MIRIDRPTVQYIFRILAASILYFIAAKFGLAYAAVNPSTTAIWPPTGFAIAIIILFGYHMWPAIFIGAFLANLFTAGTVATSLGIAVGNTLEAVVARYLVMKYANGDHAFDQPRTVVLFILLTSVVSTMVSAFIGADVLLSHGLAPLSRFWDIWLTWWLGDLGGAVTITPFILLWYLNPKITFKIRKLIEFAILLLTIAWGSFFVFSGIFPYPYLLIPILLWAAFRFGPRETASMIVLVALIATKETLRGHGPFALEGMGDINVSLIHLQVFIAVLAITKLTVASVVVERLEADKEIERRERRFRTLIEKSSDVVVLIDNKSFITYVSPSIARVLGYTPDEFMSQRGLGFMHPDDLKLAENNLRNILSAPNKTTIVEARIKHKNGEWVWIESISTNLLHDPNIRAIVVNFRDISERKELEQSKNEFLQMAAHQLRAPLSTMRWSTELLMKDSAKLSKTQKEKVDLIYESNQKMIRQVNELLSVSRIMQGDIPNNPVSVNIADVIAHEVDAVSASAKARHIAVKLVKPTDGIPPLFLDPDRIASVIENILSNAIKYSDPDSEVILSYGKTEDGVWVTIEDDGIGIPPAEQPLLFTKFFRTANAKLMDSEGTGLGLFVVKSFLSGWGGSIDIQSPTHKSRGTTVHLTIPIIMLKKKEAA
jgi:PAS domain S-box-containing protein